MEMFRATILQDAHGIGFMTVNMLMRERGRSFAKRFRNWWAATAE